MWLVKCRCLRVGGLDLAAKMSELLLVELIATKTSAALSKSRTFQINRAPTTAIVRGPKSWVPDDVDGEGGVEACEGDMWIQSSVWADFKQCLPSGQSNIRRSRLSSLDCLIERRA